MNETKEVKDIIAGGSEKETRSPAKKREFIKTLIIIFLAAMLVLTFFSNTIMNKSLPEISTETVTSGKLTERIRGSGVVESNQAYDVIIDGSRSIEKIHIKAGQEVEKDDVLFTVNPVGEEALAAEEAALDELKLAYETALLKEPVDYAKENQAIKTAREELNSLIAKRDAARSKAGSASAAKDEYLRNKSELSRLTNDQTKIESTIRAIESDSYIEAAPEYSQDLAALLSAYSIAEEEYKTAYETYQKAIETGNDVENAKNASDEKEAARNTARDAYNDRKSSIRSDLVSKLSDTENSINSLNSAIERYTSDYGDGSGDSYESLAEQVTAKQNALEDLIIDLNSTKRTDSISDQKTALELESKKKALDKQQEKVDKLKKESKATEIKSKYSGVVSSINVQPGESVTDGTVAATIDLVEDGFTVKIYVDNDKVKKIKKGAEADIVNNWNDDISAVLSEIKNDSSAGLKKKLLVFSVTGDVKSGESLELSIPCGSGTYDAIVPKSAVKSEDSGYYVYTVRSKNTPLGNRYYVEKVTVNKEIEDEVSCAVSGGLGRGDYVITAASKPISAGDQVRMKDK